MDKLDILIQKIDDGIARDKAVLTALTPTSKDQELRAIRRYICYLEKFREIVLEMKEE